MLKLIVAYDSLGGIGLKGKMPWSIPEEMKIFKTLTMGHAIIFGRTTFDGIKRALPGRKTYVATRLLSYHVDDPNIEIIHDLEPFLRQAVVSPSVFYICGGSDLYRQAMPYVQEASVSILKEAYACDAFFPDLSWSGFEVLSKEEYPQFTHVILRRTP